MNAAIYVPIYLLGALFVTVFAFNFFNAPPGFRPKDSGVEEILKLDPELQPALPKYVTDRTRYRLYSWIFVFMTLALFFFISIAFPNLIGYTNSTSLSAFVVGTLMFIGLSPKIPYIREILEKFKKGLYKKAQIPDKGMAVFRHLMYGELDKTSERYQTIINSMLSETNRYSIKDSLTEDYYYFDKETIERKWARLIYLVHCLDMWSEEEPFKRHIDSAALCWLPIKSHCMEKLLPQMVAFKQGNQISDDQKAELKTDLHNTLVRVYWLITLLLFMSNKGGMNPVTPLKNIGWIINPDILFRFSMNNVVFSGLSIILAILLGIVLIYALHTSGILSTNSNSVILVQWPLFGFFMFIPPLLVSLYFKRCLSLHNIWAVQRPENPVIPFAQRPWVIYFLVALVSYVITFALLAMLTYAWFYGASAGDWPEKLKMLAVYTLIAAISSIYICYLIDSPSRGWEKDYSYYIRSIIPALGQSLSYILIVSICVVLFSESNSFELTSFEKDKWITQSITVFLVGIAVHMTSRLRSKHYERRESERMNNASVWLTISLDGVSRRVEKVTQRQNGLSLIADSDLTALADLGDEVEFYYTSDQVKRGRVESINNGQLNITFL